MTILLKILFGILLLLTTVLGLASFLIDPNAYKEDITTQIAEATGLQIAIEGDLSLSLFPSIELEINDASVANSAGFGEEPLARLEQARIRAKWSPLLGGHLVVERILLRGLTLNLIRNVQGHGNWEQQTAATSADPPSTADPGGPRIYPVVYTESTAGAAGPSPIDRVSINTVEITDSRVQWTDQLFGSRIIVSELNGSTGRIAAETPIGLKLNGKASGLGRGWNTSITLDTLVTTDRDIRYLALSPTELHLTELTTAQGFVGQAVLTAAIEADLTTRRYLANGLTVRFTAGGAALWNASIQADLLTDLTLDLRAQTLQLSPLSVSSGALQLNGNLTAQQLSNAPTAGGHLTISEVDLRAWLKQQGLPTLITADPAALSKVALKTDWQMAAGRLDLRTMELTLDQTRGTGWAALLPTNPAGYRFEIEVDTIDLDRYLPLAVDGRTSAIFGQGRQAAITPVGYDPTTAPTVVVSAAAMPAVQAIPVAHPTPSLFPVELIRHLDLDGHIKLGELRIAKLVFEDTKLHIGAVKGRMHIENAVEHFYDGRIDGTMALAAQTDLPGLSLEQRAAGVRMGQMLKDLTGDDVLTGRGEISARLNASGQDLDSIKRSLNGKLQLNLSAGVIKGFDIQQMISEAQARLTGKPTPPWRPAQTEYTTLTASARILDGVLNNDDLLGTSEYLHVNGHGSIDIANEQLDYRLSPRLVDPPEGRGIKELEDIPIPVRLTGDFRNPKWDVELGSVLRDVANRGLGEDIEEKAGKLIRKLEESTGIKGLEQGLRGLFGF